MVDSVETDQIGFPSPIAADDLKNTDEYALKLFRSIWKRFAGDNSALFTSQLRRYSLARSYANGMQSTMEMIDMLNIDGKSSYSDYDMTPLPIARKFIEILMGQFMERDEKANASAIDPISTSKKEQEKLDAHFRMEQKDTIKEINQMAGIPIFNEHGFSAETKNDIDLYFGYNYKQQEETLIEQGVALILYENDWREVKKMLLMDLISCGKAATKTYFDENKRIRIKRVLPEYFVSGYSDRSDSKDSQYFGEVNFMKISEARMRWPKIPEKDLYEFAKKFSGRYSNPEMSGSWNQTYDYLSSRPYDEFTIALLEVSVRLVDGINYETIVESSGKTTLHKRKKLDPKKSSISATYYSEYCGYWVIDTDTVLDWGRAKNQIKPEDKLEEVILPYSTYKYNAHKGTNRALVEQMIPSIKAMQVAHLKINQIIAKARPNGFFIDISGLQDIDLGLGKGNIGPMELQQIADQTGNIYYRSVKDDGDKRSAPPITPQLSEFGSSLGELISVYNFELKILSDMIGINPIAEGSGIAPRMSSSTVQSAVGSANNATAYIYDAFLSIMAKTCQQSVHRLWDVLIYGKKEYNGYALALDKTRIDFIKINGDGLKDTLFDVRIEVGMDPEAQQQLEEEIKIALGEKSIDLEDAINTRMLASQSNIKMATFYLIQCRRKKKQEDQAFQQSQNQQQMQQAGEQAQQAQQSAMMQEQMKLEYAIKLHDRKQEGLERLKTMDFTNTMMEQSMLPGATLPDWFKSSIMAATEKVQAEIMTSMMGSWMQDQQAQQQAQMQSQQQAQGGQPGADPSQPQGDPSQQQQPQGQPDPSQQQQAPQGQQPQ